MEEILNLKKAADRIKKASVLKENIFIFSDSDLDGVTALLILEESLKTLGVKSYTGFLNRREGFQLTKRAVQKLKTLSSGILIFFDFGITNHNDIELGNKLGFYTIVVDHHAPVSSLPSAKIIVDPKQKKDKYPFKELAACGLSLKLSQKILGRTFKGRLEQSLTELAAIGTLADKMPLKMDNKEIVKKGKKFFFKTFRPALRVFFKKFSGEPLENIIKKITLNLQIVDIKYGEPESYRFLKEVDTKKCEKMLELILRKSQRRKKILNHYFEKIKEKAGGSNNKFVFEGGEKIPDFAVGALAGRLAREFKKTAIIFSSNNKNSVGSVRTAEDVDCLEMLINCKRHLTKFGGHPRACGFLCPTDKIKDFYNCIYKYFENKV